MTLRRILLGALTAGVLTAFTALGIDALTLPSGPETGYPAALPVGAGWYFVPTTNLIVTSIGYLDTAAPGGDASAVVTIWSGTNSVIASYTGITDPSAPEIVLAAVPPLALVAGQPYSITVYFPPLSDPTWNGSLYGNLSGYSPFQVAAQLTQYKAWQLEPDGTFAPFDPNPSNNQQLLWLGPTFTFEVGLLRPVLTISRTNNSVVLSWPTNAAGYALQSSTLVKGSYTNVPGSPSVVGANYWAILPRTNAAAFFRLVQQN